MQEKQLTEQESIRLIAEMMEKVKSHFHESGANTILWGTVIAICGLTSFSQSFWNFSIGFDIWILTLVAIIPQVWIAVRESKARVVKTYQESAIDIIWAVYIITIMCMLVYANVTAYTAPAALAQNNLELFSKNTQTGELKPFKLFAPSFSSIMMAVYAFPTLATGLITKYKPFIVGAIICYAMFVLSLFTTFTYDMLLTALGAIVCWLIPGFFLRREYLKHKRLGNV